MTAQDRIALARDTAEAEGYRPRAYRDSKGIWTIGYGTNLQELEIDRPLAEQWLASKLAQSERECERFPWYAGMTARRQRAVCEMVYNMGLSRFLGFTKMIQALSNGNYTEAQVEALDSKWAREDVSQARSRRIAEMLKTG